MNNQNRLNNNFIDLLELDLNELKNKIAQDYSQKVTETNDIRIKHSEISKLALKNIEKVDFRGETGLNDENEKLFFKDCLVTCCDKVLETVENCGFSICNSRDNIYLFNGEYWKRASNHRNGYYRAMLGNKIVNYASEVNGKMDVSVFKQLVSGEPVDARLPYGEPFTERLRSQGIIIERIRTGLIVCIKKRSC